MKHFDIIVVGGGHAGCETALASARLGMNTILFATNLDTVAFLACNPSIGGTAKGQIVKEIDALGGQMALTADSSLLQMRMLNAGKGPAVYSPRAQVDKHAYHTNMLNTLLQQQNLTVKQAEVVSIEVLQNSQTSNSVADVLPQSNKAQQCQDCQHNLAHCDKQDNCWTSQTEANTAKFLVKTAVGLKYSAKAVVVCSGVYLNSKTIVGDLVCDSGPNGFQNAKQLSDSLQKLGFELKRFKTGTPARVKASSVHFDKMTEQKGEQGLPAFSFMSGEINGTKRSCFLTYTTPTTKEIILNNKSLAPIFNGGIEGVGPRYCPSIEDKVVRFSDKERHQIFLEPEGEFVEEYYVQGASSSMPAEVQEQIYTSIDGLHDVQILRDAYAIEYDCIDATVLAPTLMSKKIAGLFFAGQINGTSGYEEAACQGLVAGINAVRFLKKQSPFVLTRNDSYIGVLIDDITTKQSNEPYRMMTSRAEHRLVLRQDNADIRLTQIGRQIGLVNSQRFEKFTQKVEQIKQAQKLLNTIVPPKKLTELFEEVGLNMPYNGLTIADLFRRGLTFKQIQKHLGLLCEFCDEVLEQVEINVKYEGYIQRQNALLENAKRLENKTLPPDIDYMSISGLRIEARQKLDKIRPLNLGQATRISGVSPADIQILIVYLSHKQ